MEKEIDHKNTDEIICPHCGYEFNDSIEFVDYNESRVFLNKGMDIV